MSHLQLRNHGPVASKLHLGDAITLHDQVGLVIHPTDVAMPIMGKAAASWLLGEAVRIKTKERVIFSIVNFVGKSYKKNKAFPEEMEPIEVGYGKGIATAFAEAFVGEFNAASTHSKEFVELKEQVERLLKGERFLYRGTFGEMKFEAYISWRNIMIAPPPEPVDGEEQQAPATAPGFLIELQGV